ncbi:MAG: TolC family protein, partial [Flavobacteriales bacterium]
PLLTNAPACESLAIRRATYIDESASTMYPLLVEMMLVVVAVSELLAPIAICESLNPPGSSMVKTYGFAFDTYTTSKEAVAISKKIYNNYQIKFKEGLITSLDLSQIQTQYLSTQTQYIQAMYNLVSAKIELDKITNKL